MNTGMKRAIVATGMLAATLHAQAGLFGRDGDSDDCVKKHSTAWCTMDAAKMTMLGLKDVRAEDLQRQVELGKGESAWWYGGAVAGLSTGVLRPAPGLSSGTESGVLVLKLLLGSLSPEALGWNGVFGWMPLDQASTADEARAKAAATMRDATMKIFGKYSFELEWEPEDDQKVVYSVEGRGRPVYVLRGGDCEQRKCRLSILNFYAATQKVARPAWLGGGEAWGVAVGYGVRGASLAPWKLTIDGVDSTASYLQQLSRELPDWAYIWVTPEVKKRWGVVNVGQRVPGLYRRGEFMPMVFPELRALPTGQGTGAAASGS